MYNTIVSWNQTSPVWPLMYEGQAVGAEHDIPANVAEQANAYLVQAAIPGLSAEHIEVRIEGKKRTVVARPTGEQPARTRSVLLPQDVDAERAKASLTHGLLTLS